MFLELEKLGGFAPKLLSSLQIGAGSPLGRSMGVIVPSDCGLPVIRVQQPAIEHRVQPIGLYPAFAPCTRPT